MNLVSCIAFHEYFSLLVSQQKPRWSVTGLTAHEVKRNKSRECEQSGNGELLPGMAEITLIIEKSIKFQLNFN